MYGYLTVADKLLQENELKRYKACYCGLCRCIKEKYGSLYRLCLNYDMTFLVLFLNSLYEPDETQGEENCVVHPFSRHLWFESVYTEYAADITLALAYLKLRDNWLDDRNLISLSEAGLLKKAYASISAKYPETFSKIEKAMQTLHEIEESGEYLPDEASDCFGEVMSAVFTPENDRWTPTVAAFARSLGKYIYILDAAADLDRDRLLERYNPFRPLYGRTDNSELFFNILRIILSDCLREYDRLPLVRDSAILKNIVCVGLWSGFTKKFGAKEGPSDVSGSL